MKSLTFFVVFLLFTLFVTAQTSFAFTTAANRKIHDDKLRDSIIKLSMQQPLSSATEGEWMKAFWAMELMLYKTPEIKTKLSHAWKNSDKLSESFQKSLLEVCYTLYPHEFNSAVRTLLFTTSSPAVFIRGAEYLLLSKNSAIYKREIKNLLQQKFQESIYVGLALLQQRLVAKQERQPPLKDILGKNFLKGQTIVYSLQRTNRNYAGLVIIRKGDGSFVKNDDGKIFYTSQLARAITNYPYYITNGNTPQGIYKWTGFDTSSVAYIGPTANLQMVMPYESSAEVFFKNSNLKFTNWTKDLYASLLPSSWKAYDGIYESFWAGAINRSEIIMHGTTINPNFYKGQLYYPQTPSLGCLCSYEQWDKNGMRVMSNQQKIVDALHKTGDKNGYVLVINLDDKKRKVSLADVVSSLY